MGSSRRSPRGVAGALAFTGLALARGTALFVGAYSLANAISSARTAHPSQDLWWIDLRWLPFPWPAVLGILAAVVLVAYALFPRMRSWRRWLTLGTCLALAVLALHDVAGFYRAWGAGAISPGVPVPLSLVIAAVFTLLGWAAWALKPPRAPRIANAIAVVLCVALVAVLFPLAQVAFFGTSDYRAKADAAVVFGALVGADGNLSAATADRVRTAVSLYKTGLVKKLVMSGGVGSTGADEPDAMARFAEKAGVPASAILKDHNGYNTDDTVTNTIAMFRRQGVRSVLAVSQGYHLPRVKLAYLAKGWDVRTVPAAPGPVPILQTPIYIVREIPAFWTYWSRALARDVLGR